PVEPKPALALIRVGTNDFYAALGGIALQCLGLIFSRRLLMVGRHPHVLCGPNRPFDRPATLAGSIRRSHYIPPSRAQAGAGHPSAVEISLGCKLGAATAGPAELCRNT